MSSFSLSGNKFPSRSQLKMMQQFCNYWKFGHIQPGTFALQFAKFTDRKDHWCLQFLKKFSSHLLVLWKITIREKAINSIIVLFFSNLLLRYTVSTKQVVNNVERQAPALGVLLWSTDQQFIKRCPTAGVRIFVYHPTVSRNRIIQL